MQCLGHTYTEEVFVVYLILKSNLSVCACVCATKSGNSSLDVFYSPTAECMPGPALFFALCRQWSSHTLPGWLLLVLQVSAWVAPPQDAFPDHQSKAGSSEHPLLSP